MVLLNHAAVDVDDLAIDPTSWAGEKRDSLRDVRRCAEAFQGSQLGQVLHCSFVFPVQEQIGGRGAWGYGVDRDIASP